MANFEAFRETISSSINLLFLKFAIWYVRVKKQTVPDIFKVITCCWTTNIFIVITKYCFINIRYYFQTLTSDKHNDNTNKNHCKEEITIFNLFTLKFGSEKLLLWKSGGAQGTAVALIKKSVQKKLTISIDFMVSFFWTIFFLIIHIRNSCEALL